MLVLAAVVSIFMEIPVALAVAVSAFTRLSAILLVFYMLGTSLIEHRYLTTKGADQANTVDGFYKNVNIMGSFLLLYITGARKYSIAALFGIAVP